MSTLRYVSIMILCLAPVLINAQIVNSGTHELQRTLFISEVHGLTSTFINPAGLASQSDDDGILLGYGSNDKEKGEFVFSMSLGDMGLGYKESKLNVDTLSYHFKEYGVALAAGNKYISFGTTTKYVESETENNKDQNFNFDAGIIIRPVSFIGFAALVRNLHIQDKLPDLMNRNFQVGVYLAPIGSAFKIMAELIWKDAQDALKQGNIKTAVEFSLSDEFDIRFGTYNFNQPNKTFFCGLNLRLVEGIKFYSSVRFNKTSTAPNFMGALIIPMQ